MAYSGAWHDVVQNANPSSPRVIGGPFKILMKEVLLADYSVHYELRLRDLSAACGCVPAVELLSARVVESALESALPPK